MKISFLNVFIFLCIAGQFYIVGASQDILNAGSQRSIAPRGSIHASRDPATSNRGGGGQGEPVIICKVLPIFYRLVNLHIPTFQRDDRRRVSHNEVERRRRDKINNWILKLGKIMPDSVHNDTGKTGQVLQSAGID